MSPYEPTAAEQDLLNELQQFKSAVAGWAASSRPSERERHRSLINQQLEEVREIVRLAGCGKTMLVQPPAAVGGLVAQIDPFDHIFEPVYGRRQHDIVLDQIDCTIGVIQAGKYEERCARLSKASGVLGPVSGKKVFLVHGHDEAAREAAARYLGKLNLEAIVLHEKASSGKTVIEKIERYSEVAYAVVLLTPDDVGAERGHEDSLRPRARQNVILELGFFVGSLGRSNVAALVKGDLEWPSDFAGVVHIDMDEKGAWQILLARELKAAGLNVDLNDVV